MPDTSDKSDIVEVKFKSTRREYYSNNENIDIKRGDKIVVADLEGYVHWISKSDGRVLARTQPFDVRYLSQPQSIDSKVIVIDTSGQLSVLTQDKTLPSPAFSTIRFRN